MDDNMLYEGNKFKQGLSDHHKNWLSIFTCRKFLL